MLVWLTQLGLSTALPLAGFLLLGVWLHNRLNWGTWVIWAGLVLGIYSAVSGLRHSLRAMELMSTDRKKQDPPPLSFSEHH